MEKLFEIEILNSRVAGDMSGVAKVVASSGLNSENDVSYEYRLEKNEGAVLGYRANGIKPPSSHRVDSGRPNTKSSHARHATPKNTKGLI